MHSGSDALWHCTDWAGFKGILQSRSILPNTGERRFRHGLSHMGAVAKLGAVALFDGSVEPKRSMFDSWLTAHRPITIAFKLDAEQLRKNVITGQGAGGRVRGLMVHGEVCHLGAIGWSAVQGCLFVRSTNPEQREFLPTDSLDRRNICAVLRRLRGSPKGESPQSG